MVHMTRRRRRLCIEFVHLRSRSKEVLHTLCVSKLLHGHVGATAYIATPAAVAATIVLLHKHAAVLLLSIELSIARVLAPLNLYLTAKPS
jgi:hypothetical protein